MAFITELRERVDTLAELECLNVEPADLPRILGELDNRDIQRVMSQTAALSNQLQRLSVVAAGVIAHRSSRERGHSGLAATEGHRTATDLVQSITGGTRADAARHVRLGESIVDADEQRDAADIREHIDAAPLWDEALRATLLEGGLTTAQHDAIVRGLGAPPPALDPSTGGIERRPEGAVLEAWRAAAEQLLGEAAQWSAEDLLLRARAVRDALDPIGAEERATRRFDGRSFRRWTDATGTKRAAIAFDDESSAWFDAVIDAGLRPRRGGPRFVAEGEKAAASALIDDPRTNEQLTYDLVIDVFRAGALANASDVFGARQPGVRIVTVTVGDRPREVGPRDAFGRLLASAHLEDGGHAVAGTVLDRALCATGYREVTVDSCGNPLDVGREQRLFTPRQTLALAVRDGGCRWPGCRVPASYSEAHYSEHWWQHDGRTDIDLGILLCRFHHMLLHNNGWRITRDGRAEFVLHPPPGRGDPIVLRSKSAVRWAWDPPPDRRGWRTPPESPSRPPSYQPDDPLDGHGRAGSRHDRVSNRADRPRGVVG